METNDKLIALWTRREIELLDTARLITGASLKARLDEGAETYRQCADELLNPPEDLFEKLGIT